MPVARPWEAIALSEFEYEYYKAMTTPVFFRDVKRQELPSHG